MENKVDEIIKEITSKKDVTEKWFINISSKISEILSSDCDEKLKEKLLMYSEHIFMCVDAIENDKNTK